MTKKKEDIEKKDKKINMKGFHKVLLSTAQEEYLDIYHKYFILRWEWTEIAKYHKCNKRKVEEAMKWVTENKLNFPSKALIKGAIDAISSRLKENHILYNAEVKKKRYRDNNFIIALSKEIREDEKILGDLENIHEHSDGGEQQGLSAGQVLKLISEASKNK